MITGVERISRNWWLFLILGLVSILAAILAIVYPDITLLALGLFVGITLLITGVMEIIEAIAGPPDLRPVNAILGVLSVVAGLICIRRPGESLLALIVVLGIYLVVSGGIAFVRAFATIEDRAARLGIAIIDVIVGILILSLPELSLVTLAVLFAISLIVRGAYACLVAFRLRGARHAEPPGAPAAVA
jgi:uncharacterized membrane protein HdeD (DUF308 family)